MVSLLLCYNMCLVYWFVSSYVYNIWLLLINVFVIDQHKRRGLTL